MNKPLAQETTGRAGRTRAQLVGAALETLREEGFAGATSRAIARAGGFNQALIFYHFGSVDALLLAALDATSAERMQRYREAVEAAESIEDLAEVAARIYREDSESGHMTVVSQLVAGSLTRPDLAPEVLARMEPWIDFAEEALVKVVAGTALEGALPTRELAHAAVTFYLGVNLLAGLDPHHERMDAFFEQVQALAPLLAPFLERRRAE
jgi:AcrR family transcriptional regulator